MKHAIALFGESENFYCSYYAPNLSRFIIGEGVINITYDAKI